MDDATCPICLIEIDTSEFGQQLEKLHKTLCCKQVFHDKCINEWFGVSTTKTCPLCRTLDDKHKKHLAEIREKMRIRIRSDSISIVLGDQPERGGQQHEKCRMQ